MNARLPLIAIAILSFFMYSCTSVFVHPLSTGSTIYHTTPLKRDTIKSKLFVSGGVGTQIANGVGQDICGYGQGNIYNTHRFGMFNAYYGANVSLGNYRVNSTSTYYDDNAPLYNQYTGNKFFGSWGSAAGINATAFVKKRGRIRGEWRFIGVHGSFQNDWGEYYKFRQMIPTELADHVARSNKLGVIGLSTELVIYKRKPGYTSVQLQYNFLLGNAYRTELIDTEVGSRMGYFSATFYAHSLKGKSFIRLNLSNFYTYSVFWGINIGLGSSKK